MASLSFIIGLIGNIVSILVFTSPLRTFRRVVKKRSTENFKATPYVTTLLSTSLWTFYGLLKPDGLLIVTVNGAGAFLQASYVTLFLIYAPIDAKMRTLKLVAALNVGFLMTVILVTLFAVHGSLRLFIVGFLCAALTIGMYAAPLSSMRMVVKTKSVEFMPFFLSFFLFLNGGIWSAYAFLVRDFFIGVPNAVGFLLGSAQLILYIVYRKKSKAVAKGVEEGSAHLVEMSHSYCEEDGDDGTGRSEARKLAKGNSLPNSCERGSIRQLSLQKIVKMNSMSPLQNYSPV